jgi:hypothetical protein
MITAIGLRPFVEPTARTASGRPSSAATSP